MKKKKRVSVLKTYFFSTFSAEGGSRYPYG